MALCKRLNSQLTAHQLAMEKLRSAQLIIYIIVLIICKVANSVSEVHFGIDESIDKINLIPAKFLIFNVF